jgi:flagellar basal-body rod protein FlgB
MCYMLKLLLVLSTLLATLYSAYANSSKNPNNRATNNTTAVLTQHIEALAERQAVLSENISNANTPSYKAKDLDFDKKGQPHRAVVLKTTKRGHMSGASRARKYYIVKTPGAQKLNGNDVVLSDQMAKVAANQDEYNKALRSYMVTNNLIGSVLGGGN